MEDWNLLAADCVVVSCCCQCLLLQIVIFVMLKLPCKLIRKTICYAKRRFRHRKKEGKMTESVVFGFHEGSIRIEVEGFVKDGGFGCGNCMEEVEKVLEEFSRKGEFAFGSFWAGEESGTWEFPVLSNQVRILTELG